MGWITTIQLVWDVLYKWGCAEEFRSGEGKEGVASITTTTWLGTVSEGRTERVNEDGTEQNRSADNSLPPMQYRFWGRYPLLLRGLIKLPRTCPHQ